MLVATQAELMFPIERHCGCLGRTLGRRFVQGREVVELEVVFFRRDWSKLRYHWRGLIGVLECIRGLVW